MTLLFILLVSVLPAEPVTTCFTPGEQCADLIASEIAAAKEEILVQAYSFTSVPIAKALTDAHARGVKVHAILDKSNATAKYSAATFLTHAAIPTLIDAAHAIAHNKVMVIDGKTVITGSFNFTKNAQASNAENVIILKNVDVAQRYISNWKQHEEHSTAY